MTECNGCGDCCDPVAIIYTQEFVRKLDPRKRRELIGARSTRWILEELEPIPWEEGMAMSPHLNSGRTEMHVQGIGKVEIGTQFYRCRNLDPETRRCMAYDDRPPECSGYPWYDGTPDQYDEELKRATPLPARCSFNADLGRPVAVERPRRRERIPDPTRRNP